MIRTTALFLAAALGAAPAAAAPMNADDYYAANCANFANLLPRIVRRETVAAVNDGYLIHVRPFCRGAEFNDLGNAGGLTHTIAGNHALVAALAARGWRADDVMFIAISGERVDLWVHRN